MQQANMGTAAPDMAELEVQTVWPAIAVYPLGRRLGRLFAIRWPNIYFFRVGYLLALASIPVALVLYFWRVAPYRGLRYTLTNRHVQIRRGLSGTAERSIALDGFEQVEIVERDGYGWYHAGDLVFRKAGLEVFRLEAVVRPDVFCHTCTSVRQAFVRVRDVRRQQQVCA